MSYMIYIMSYMIYIMSYMIYYVHESKQFKRGCPNGRV